MKGGGAVIWGSQMQLTCPKCGQTVEATADEQRLEFDLSGFSPARCPHLAALRAAGLPVAEERCGWLVVAAIEATTTRRRAPLSDPAR